MLNHQQQKERARKEAEHHSDNANVTGYKPTMMDKLEDVVTLGGHSMGKKREEFERKEREIFRSMGKEKEYDEIQKGR